MAEQATKAMPKAGPQHLEQGRVGRLQKATTVGGPAAGKGFWTRKSRLVAIGLPLILLAGFVVAEGAEGKLPFLGDLQGVMSDAPRQQAPVAAVFYDLPEFLVNLNSADSTYLKLSVALELESGERSRELDRYLPRLVDSFQVFLRDLRVEDLQGSAGLQRLREDLLRRANTAVPQAQVQDVLFKQLLVQ